MIFKQWEQVLDGTKTQTRRPVKQGESWVGLILDSSARVKWGRGRTYAVQPGRGKKAVGRILITKIRRERLGMISSQDAMAEGCPMPSQARGELDFVARIGSARACFKDLWQQIHGHGAWERMKDDDVWVLEFELVK